MEERCARNNFLVVLNLTQLLWRVLYDMSWLVTTSSWKVTRGERKTHNSLCGGKRALNNSRYLFGTQKLSNSCSILLLPPPPKKKKKKKKKKVWGNFRINLFDVNHSMIRVGVSWDTLSRTAECSQQFMTQRGWVKGRCLIGRCHVSTETI